MLRDKKGLGAELTCGGIKRGCVFAFDPREK